MIGLDTNILVRLVMQDEPIQTAQVVDFLSKVKQSGETLLVNNVVLCELVWVLGRGYKVPKEKILSFLNELIHTKEVRFFNKEILRHAIELYKKGQGDFADYLNFATNKEAGCIETYSFDGKLIQEGVFKAPLQIH